MSPTESEAGERVVDVALPKRARRRRPVPWEEPARLRRAEELRDLLIEARGEERDATAPTLEELDRASAALPELAPAPPPGAGRPGLALAEGAPGGEAVSQEQSLAFWSSGAAARSAPSRPAAPAFDLSDLDAAESGGLASLGDGDLEALPDDGPPELAAPPDDDEDDAVPGHTGEYLWGSEPSRDAGAAPSEVQLEAVMASYSLTGIPAVPESLAALSVEEAIAEAEKLFGRDKAAEAMALLEAVGLRTGGDPRIETWYALGERRLIRRYCPDAGAGSVPRLVADQGELLRRARGSQRALVAAIDGKRTMAQLRELLPGIKVVGFWKDMALLKERGWVAWEEGA